MRRLRLWLSLSLAIMAWSRGSSGADTPASFPNGPAAFASRVVAPIEDAALAETIDQSLAARWEKEGVTPAPHAGDAEFLRRVSLDVAGRIPPVSEARAFLQSTDPQKRRKLVERLLAGPAHANHMTGIWLELLVPEAKATVQAAFYAGDFQVWLRKQFTEGVGYDKIVRELLTVPAASGQMALNRAGAQDIKPSPFAFIAAKEGKPENLAASTSRTFLGIRLECAQCHNHPFATWKRDEFWGMAAFFAGIERRGNGAGVLFQGTDIPDKYDIEVPGSKRIVQASFLDGRKLERNKGKSVRAELADWVTSRDNPYFARAAANRVWFQFFGTGLIDPVDDMSAVADAMHPELLDLMADQFAAHDFDLKYLIRAITSSRAYQLSSAGGSPSSNVSRLFGRMSVRGLTPEQLYENLIMATGLPREVVPRALVVRNNSLRGEFIERFASQEERPTDRQTSILQALTLMNGRLVDDATSFVQGATLSAVADSYFLDTTGRIETLYLAALTRFPRPAELERLIPYVERGGPTLDTKKALADVLWSLLASAEFVFNH
jgi:Protein of unknown function (DUF1549)/Protein of unknown function (DUF1553)